MAVTRPALRYYGGKWKLAPWIIDHFPPHESYVEPCGGAASVLLQKSPSPLETYNDLDGNVVNFFRVLRDKPDELIHKMRLTPWARAEYELSTEPTTDDVERARRFAVGSMLSVSGMPWSSGFRALTGGRDTVPGRHTATSDNLYAVAERLMMVQIENDTYQRIIVRYDSPNTLVYFDPPYPKSERTNQDEYYHEWTDEDHAEAAYMLKATRGHVVISGYACPLYTDLYERHGWHRVDKEAQTNSGGKRTESLWLSPRTYDAVFRRHANLPLFANGAAQHG